LVNFFGLSKPFPAFLVLSNVAMWLKPALIKARQGRNSFTKRPKKLVGQPFLVVLTVVVGVKSLDLPF